MKRDEIRQVPYTRRNIVAEIISSQAQERNPMRKPIDVGGQCAGEHVLRQVEVSEVRAIVENRRERSFEVVELEIDVREVAEVAQRRRDRPRNVQID